MLGKRKYNKPIEDRIHNIVACAINWAKLRHMDNRDKRIAIILHNNPPRNDNIGGAGRARYAGVRVQFDQEA